MSTAGTPQGLTFRAETRSTQFRLQALIRLIPLVMKASILSRTCHCRGFKAYNRRVGSAVRLHGAQHGSLHQEDESLDPTMDTRLLLGVSPADKQLKAPSPRSSKKQKAAADHIAVA